MKYEILSHEELVRLEQRRLFSAGMPDDTVRADTSPEVCPVPIVPGWAGQASKMGWIDFYIDAMNSKYGGEW